MFTIHGFIIAISINNTLKVNLYTLLLYITFYTFISEREAIMWTERENQIVLADVLANKSIYFGPFDGTKITKRTRQAVWIQLSNQISRCG